MIYSFLRENKPSRLSFKRACLEASVSRSGYFKYLRAFYRALRGRSAGRGLVIHSDRGVQYTARAFRENLKQLGFIQSMSRKGICYDNSYCESFFFLLKRELGVNLYSDIEKARRHVFEWIEAWYNTHRLHSSLGYKSSEDFEKKELFKQKPVLKKSPLF